MISPLDLGCPLIDAGRLHLAVPAFQRMPALERARAVKLDGSVDGILGDLGGHELCHGRGLVGRPHACVVR